MVYEQRIKEMCSANKETLEVSFMELSQILPTIAVFVAGHTHLCVGTLLFCSARLLRSSANCPLLVCSTPSSRV